MNSLDPTLKRLLLSSKKPGEFVPHDPPLGLTSRVVALRRVPPSGPNQECRQIFVLIASSALILLIVETAFLTQHAPKRLNAYDVTPALQLIAQSISR